MNETLFAPLKEGAAITVGSVGSVFKPAILIMLGCVLFFLIIKLIMEARK